MFLVVILGCSSDDTKTTENQEAETLTTSRSEHSRDVGEQGGEEGEESEEKSPRRDRIMSLSPPFDMSQAKLHILNTDKDQSFSDIRYAMEGDLAFVTVSDSDNDNGEST